MLPLLADAAGAQVVINEIDYDQVGTDIAEFIELKNTGFTPVNLDTFSIRLINGGAPIPADYASSPIDLPDVDLAAGDYFVISGNAAAVSNTDFVVGSFTIQNGSPDAVQLLDGAAIEDTVSYEGTTTGFSEGIGAAAADDDVTPNIGLSRSPDGVDTNDNDTDISRRCITPGAPNSLDVGMCTAPLIVRATKTDSLVSVLGVSGDVDADGVADPGDTISYTIEIEALGVARRTSRSTTCSTPTRLLFPARSASPRSLSTRATMPRATRRSRYRRRAACWPTTSIRTRPRR